MVKNRRSQKAKTPMQSHQRKKMPGHTHNHRMDMIGEIKLPGIGRPTDSR